MNIKVSQCVTIGSIAVFILFTAGVFLRDRSQPDMVEYITMITLAINAAVNVVAEIYKNNQ